jgi:predicted site-specific integrase-resolvase
MATEFLTTQELCDRWKVRSDTLYRWRQNGDGPPYIKLGKDSAQHSRIIYKLSEIEAYEAEKSRGKKDKDGKDGDDGTQS